SRANPELLDVDSSAEAVGLVLADGFEVAIIDTPPELVTHIEEAIAQADLVVIPCSPSALELRAIEPVVELCEAHNKPFCFVLNRVFAKRVKLTTTAQAYLRKRGTLCEAMLSERLSYVSAMTLGKGPSEVDKDGAIKAEIDALWTELEAMLAKKGRK